MRIAIIGAGQVGRAIGEGWKRAGHQVTYGVRAPSTAGEARPADAAAAAEVIAIATPWEAVEGICASLGDVAGKIIIDCTNPLAMTPQGLGLKPGIPHSGGELVQTWCRNAAVFKTLNQVGFETMANTAGFAARPVMLVAGDDAAAKPQVMQLVSELGFEAADCGPLANARLIEHFAMLWIDLAFKRGQGRNFAFSLTRR